MNVTWYGQSCFKLQNSQQTILIDPYSPRKHGLRGPNFKAEIIILTDPEDEKIVRRDLKQECFLINGPGEYEIKNIFVYGLDFVRKNKRLVIYRLEMDDIQFGILGEIDTLLNDQEIEKLDGLDVLFIPVGGGNLSLPARYSPSSVHPRVHKDKKADEPVREGEQIDLIDPKRAIEIIDSLEPKLVVPCCFKIPGIRSNLLPLSQFLNQAGIKDVEKLNKLSLQKKYLIQEQIKIVVLEPGG